MIHKTHTKGIFLLQLMTRFILGASLVLTTGCGKLARYNVGDSKSSQKSVKKKNYLSVPIPSTSSSTHTESTSPKSMRSLNTELESLSRELSLEIDLTVPIPSTSSSTHTESTSPKWMRSLNRKFKSLKEMFSCEKEPEIDNMDKVIYDPCGKILKFKDKQGLSETEGTIRKPMEALIDIGVFIDHYNIDEELKKDFLQKIKAHYLTGKISKESIIDLIELMHAKYYYVNFNKKELTVELVLELLSKCTEIQESIEKQFYITKHNDNYYVRLFDFYFSKYIVNYPDRDILLAMAYIRKEIADDFKTYDYQVGMALCRAIGKDLEKDPTPWLDQIPEFNAFLRHFNQLDTILDYKESILPFLGKKDPCLDELSESSKDFQNALVNILEEENITKKDRKRFSELTQVLYDSSLNGTETEKENKIKEVSACLDSIKQLIYPITKNHFLKMLNSDHIFSHLLTLHLTERYMTLAPGLRKIASEAMLLYLEVIIPQRQLLNKSVLDEKIKNLDPSSKRMGILLSYQDANCINDLDTVGVRPIDREAMTTKNITQHNQNALVDEKPGAIGISFSSNLLNHLFLHLEKNRKDFNTSAARLMTAAYLTFTGGHSINEAYTVFGYQSNTNFEPVSFETLYNKGDLKEAIDYAYQELFNVAKMRNGLTPENGK